MIFSLFEFFSIILITRLNFWERYCCFLSIKDKIVLKSNIKKISETEMINDGNNMNCTFDNVKVKTPPLIPSSKFNEN